MGDASGDTFRDTFRGTTMNSTLSRTTLYSKNRGTVDVNRNGLVRTESPISNQLLLSVTSVSPGVRDPISGTSLLCNNGQAQVTAPACKQPSMRSRKFYLDKDIDVTIQQLRMTTKVSSYTNEKVGTAGTPTGIEKTLVAYTNKP